MLKGPASFYYITHITSRIAPSSKYRKTFSDRDIAQSIISGEDMTTKCRQTQPMRCNNCHKKTTEVPNFKSVITII